MAITTIGTPLSSQPVGFSGDFTRSYEVVAGTAKALVVATRVDVISASGVTYGGTPLTPVGFSATSTTLWYLVNPPVGTADVVISYSDASVRNKGMGVITLAGVDQTTPVGDAQTIDGAGEAANRTITTTAADSWVLDSFGIEIGSSFTPGAGQTAYHSQSRSAASHREVASPGQITMSWTWSGSGVWRLTAAEFLAATGEVPSDLLLLLHARGDD